MRRKHALVLASCLDREAANGNIGGEKSSPFFCTVLFWRVDFQNASAVLDSVLEVLLYGVPPLDEESSSSEFDSEKHRKSESQKPKASYGHYQGSGRHVKRQSRGYRQHGDADFATINGPSKAKRGINKTTTVRQGRDQERHLPKSLISRLCENLEMLDCRCVCTTTTVKGLIWTMARTTYRKIP